MNSDFLRAPSTSTDQTINNIYRDKDDGGGSFYCADYCGEDESQEQKDKRRAFAWYQVEKAREFYSNEANKLAYLVSKKARKPQQSQFIS